LAVDGWNVSPSTVIVLGYESREITVVSPHTPVIGTSADSGTVEVAGEPAPSVG